MKNYKEVADSVFERREQYINEKKNKKKMLLRTLPALCCLCLITFVCISVWHSGVFSKNIDILDSNPNDIVESSSESQDDFEIDEELIVWNNAAKDETSTNHFINVWCKRVSGKLIEVMKNSKASDIFAISLSVKSSDSFIYNGKTIKEYKEAANNEKVYRKKLVLLLDDGPYLKYGEKIYTEGAPSGEKWAKDVYDKKIEYYGQDILSKYIVNGEFLAEEVVDEIKKYDEGNYVEENQKLYEEAIQACKKQCMDDLIKIFEGMHIKYKMTEDKDEIIIFLTASEFESLDFDGIENYIFEFAVKA